MEFEDVLFPIPAACSHCDAGHLPEHWYWMRDQRYKAGGKWRPRCLKRLSNARHRVRVAADPVRDKEKREYFKKYHLDRPHRGKYKAYRHTDKVRGFTNDLDTSWAYPMMFEPCFYCGRENAIGLDRKDSNQGHLKSNVVPCCEFCNMLLIDIPFQAKLALKPGLKEIYEKNLAADFVLRTKRHRLKGDKNDEV